MTLTAETLAYEVEKVFIDCLFRPEEVEDGKPKEGEMVVVEAIVATFGFHPARLESHREDVRRFLLLLPDNFFAGKGGGWTFLMLPFANDGEQWGEHRNAEQLLALAIGLKFATYPLFADRETWKDLPGGVPYIAFDLGEPR
jgi:hypothetical protein